MPLQYAQINPDMPGHEFIMDDEVLGKERLSCAKAHDKDKALLDPIQFYPRYMHCLVDYGFGRGLAEWNSNK